MEEVISFKGILLILKRRLVTLIMAVLICTSTVMLITYVFVIPKYSSEIDLVLGFSSESGHETLEREMDQLNFNITMLDTYDNLLNSPAVLAEVSADLEGGDYSIKKLQDMVSMSREEKSQIFTIEVIDSSPENAKQIVEKVVSVFQTKVQELLGSNQKISIIAPATVNSKAISPNAVLNMISGVIFGLLTGISLILFTEFMDKRVKNENFISSTLGYANLGVVSTINLRELSVRENRK
ncbi:Wzz/FepE/Etk N-terminal domain-containing protein [uncultured Vagococcus sp.]|uniref:YveK family protein n=1 Tax=uncultured Vagococcus sp. TaxID=189676 RepID=UPI0028D732C2|nr:Wzz/FepE/Etk N-terminal domain-containing protein [uncultured Vagococcus sp.]